MSTPFFYSQLDDLIRDAAAIERDKGFGTQTFGEDIALIHSELSEALEEYRNGKRPSVLYKVGGSSKPEGIPSELADVVIRIAGLCGRHNVDLAGAIREKMVYNRTREHRHGGKKL